MRVLAPLVLAVFLAVPAPRSLSISEYVGPTAADGGAIGFSTYLSTSRQVCEHAVVWQPTKAKNRLTYFRRPDQCRRFEDGGAVEQVYFGGGRLVWTDFTGVRGGACIDMYSGTLADPKARPVAGAPCGGPTKRSFDFAGHGSSIVFTSFFWCDEMDSTVCPSGGGPHGRYRVTLWRILGGRAVRLTGLPDRTDLLAAGDGQIALRRPDGAIDLYALSGRRLRTISYGNGDVAAAWLDSGRLVVRTNNGLDLRAASDGRLLRTLRLPASARVGSVRSGLAAYVVGSTIHLLRLADGRDRPYRTIGHTFGEVFNPSGAFYNPVPVGVLLDRTGLFYFYEADAGPPGRIVFVPAAAIQKEFR